MLELISRCITILYVSSNLMYILARYFLFIFIKNTCSGIHYLDDNDQSIVVMSWLELDDSSSTVWYYIILLIWINLRLTPRILPKPALVVLSSLVWSFKYGTTCFFISASDIPRCFPGTLMKWTRPALSKALKPIQSSV